MALEVVENGTCDIISLGRPLLADPDYVNKLRANNYKSIRHLLCMLFGMYMKLQIIYN